jgi:hypothetical protein
MNRRARFRLLIACGLAAVLASSNDARQQSPPFGSSDDWDHRVEIRHVTATGALLLRSSTLLLRGLGDEFVSRPKIEWVEPRIRDDSETPNLLESPVAAAMVADDESTRAASEALSFLTSRIKVLANNAGLPGSTVTLTLSGVIRVVAPPRENANSRVVDRTDTNKSDLEKSAALAELKGRLTNGNLPELYGLEYNTLQLLQSRLVVVERREYETKVLAYILTRLLREREFAGVAPPKIVSLNAPAKRDRDGLHAAARYKPALDSTGATIAVDPFLPRLAFFYYCGKAAADLADRLYAARTSPPLAGGSDFGTEHTTQNPWLTIHHTPIELALHEKEEYTQFCISRLFGYLASELGHELGHHLIKLAKAPMPAGSTEEEAYCDKFGLDLSKRVFGFGNLDFKRLLSDKACAEGFSELLGAPCETVTKLKRVFE